MALSLPVRLLSTVADVLYLDEASRDQPCFSAGTVDRAVVDAASANQAQLRRCWQTVQLNAQLGDT
jgi:hypothetical protein